MKKLVIGLLLGWILNSVALEYVYYEHYDLTIDALDEGYNWKSQSKGTTIKSYIDQHDTEVLKYLLWRPELWQCRWNFKHDKCLIKALLRKPIPIDQRPKRED